jgi:hypothetical protein
MQLESKRWGVDVVVSRAPQLKNDNDGHRKANRASVPGAGKSAGRDG